MPDGVVWLPTNPWPNGSARPDTTGVAVRRTLGATEGSVVTVAREVAV